MVNVGYAKPHAIREDPAGLKARVLQRIASLERDRSTWDDQWRNLADYIQPRRARFTMADRNKNRRKTGGSTIINPTASLAVRTCSAGMMAGITSPSRVWFRLAPPDPGMINTRSIKTYLDTSETRMRFVFAKSNIYACLSGATYPDIITFGSHATIVEEDREDIIRGYSFPIGEFSLASSGRGVIDQLGRRFVITISQAASMFGAGALCPTSQALLSAGQLENEITVAHLIEPNLDMVWGRADRHGMAWRSCWVEEGAPADWPPLRTMGFRDWPGLTPRWGVTGLDTYGYCPGMEALPDVMALQLLERRKAQLIDKAANPPMVGPDRLIQGAIRLGPGETTLVPDSINGAKFEPAVMVNPQAIPATDATIRVHEQRINDAFFANLWMMISQDDRNQRATAREIEEKHEERLLQLGPVLERLNDELLSPLIDRTFQIMQRKGLLPKPPRELAGKELRIEFISIMHQAQKLVGLSSIRTLVQDTLVLAQAKPKALDKLDEDNIIDELASILGTRADLVKATDDVAEDREEDEREAKAAQVMEAAPGIAGAAKDLGTTPSPSSGEPTALSDLMAQMGPMAGAGLPDDGGDA